MSDSSLSTPRAAFYFDLGSPYAYLAAERIHEVIAEPVRWQPISLGALFKLAGRSSWAVGDAHSRERGIEEIERRAQVYGLAPLQWPNPWPGNYLMAMRAAIYAQRVGRVHEFVICAFRNAFKHGHDLSVPERVLQAAGDAGLDPREVDDATQEPKIKLGLREATDAAHRLGVFGVPTIAVDGELFWGDDTLERAGAYMSRTA